jgi:TRADD-N domain-containing protein
VDKDYFSPLDFMRGFIITRTTAGPFMIVAGLFLLVLPGSQTGALQTVKLIISGLLVLGGMLVTYLGVLRDGADVKPPPSTTGDLGLAVEQLSRNYEWIRSQTVYAFFLSAAFMALGLFVILLGSARSILGLGEGTNNLTTIAGIFAEFISGTALVLYRSSSVRMNEVSMRLHETWRILAAYRLAKDLPETDQKDALLPLITALAGTQRN